MYKLHKVIKFFAGILSAILFILVLSLGGCLDLEPEPIAQLIPENNCHLCEFKEP